MPPPAGRTERLFFALWPDEATRAALAGLSRMLHEQCGGRRVAEHNIHLTLVFLGNVRADLVPLLLQAGAETRGVPIDIDFNSVEYWRRNRLVCAGARSCPPALPELCARLREAALRLGIPTETRDYVPHVTLLRKAERAPARKEFDAIVWHACEFVLMRSLLSRTAAAYEMTGRWPLAQPNHHREGRSHPAV